jgi:hypothetical protein
MLEALYNKLIDSLFDCCNRAACKCRSHCFDDCFDMSVDVVRKQTERITRTFSTFNVEENLEKSTSSI